MSSDYLEMGPHEDWGITQTVWVYGPEGLLAVFHEVSSPVVRRAGVWTIPFTHSVVGRAEAQFPADQVVYMMFVDAPLSKEASE